MLATISEGFVLNGTEFGIGPASLTRNATTGLLSVEVVGDATRADAMGTDAHHPFHWILDPPKLYLREVPFHPEAGLIRLVVDEAALDAYDIALYLLEHHDIFGTATLAADGAFRFSGLAVVGKTTMPLHLTCRLSLR